MCGDRPAGWWNYQFQARGSPACAGIDPTACQGGVTTAPVPPRVRGSTLPLARTTRHRAGFSRVCGDRPLPDFETYSHGRVPPLVRGSTPRPARAILGHAAHRLCRLGSPACAGIDLGPISRRWRRAWFSRPRGDRPSATTSACVRSGVSPPAGIDPYSPRPFGVGHRFPRLRGDRPTPAADGSWWAPRFPRLRGDRPLQATGSTLSYGVPPRVRD